MDVVWNAGTVAVAPSVMKFYLSRDEVYSPDDILLGSRSVPALAADTYNTGATSVIIPEGTPVGSYTLIAVADAENSIVETYETNNAASSGIAIEHGDLRVSALSLDITAAPAQTMTIADTAWNSGVADIGPSTTRFYLSVDAVLDAGDILLGSRSVPALPGGGTDSGNSVLTIPAATLAGTYSVIALADADNSVAEASETNNTNAQSLIISYPDIEVPVLTASTAAAPGQQISISDTVLNSGPVDAEASLLKLYLSPDQVLDATDILLGSRAVPALHAGENSSGSISAAVPLGTPTGTYYVIAAADADSAVTEASETNNTRVQAITISVPDLQVSSLSSPAASGPGQILTVSETISNSGLVEAGASTTRFYLSGDQTLDAADVLLGSRLVPPIPSAGSNSATTTITIPAATQVGAYYIIAAADAGGALTEASETNNIRVQAMAISHPDLQVSSFSAPAGSGPGQLLTVSDVVSNSGLVGAGACTMKFYLSNDQTFDADDLLLGSRAVPAIPAGGNSPASTALIVPAATPVGAYTIIAVVDADNVIVESAETNNTNAGSITLAYPDLQLSSLSVSANAGRNITVTDSVRNAGPGDAPASAIVSIFPATRLSTQRTRCSGAAPYRRQCGQNQQRKREPGTPRRPFSNHVLRDRGCRRGEYGPRRERDEQCVLPAPYAQP